MVRHMPSYTDESFSPLPLAVGLFVSAFLLVGLCAKHATQVRRKHEEPNTPRPPKSPLRAPKQLITISHQAMVHLLKKYAGPGSDADINVGGKEDQVGLWQKAILMGEKCQPPEFSGAIYYDYAGNRIPELPKSPRASPLRTFPLHVEKGIDGLA